MHSIGSAMRLSEILVQDPSVKPESKAGDERTPLEDYYDIRINK